MKLRHLLDSTRLERSLKRAVAREDRFTPGDWQNTFSRDVAIASFYPVDSRRETLLWLRNLTYSVFHFSPDTFALAMNVFDRFLCAVKVQSKHIRCIAAASLLIAAKICQEPENEPSAEEIVNLGSCTFTRGDVTRMERIILNKLNWDIDAATPLSLLNILHAMVCSWGNLASTGVQPMRHLRRVTDVLESCLLDITFASCKPSVLALAVLSSELRQLEGCDWLDITLDLQSIAAVSGQQLSVYFERVQSLKAALAAPPKAARVMHVLSARRLLFGASPPDSGVCTTQSCPIAVASHAHDEVVSSDDDLTSDDSDPEISSSPGASPADSDDSDPDEPSSADATSEADVAALVCALPSLAVTTEDVCSISPFRPITMQPDLALSAACAILRSSVTPKACSMVSHAPVCTPAVLASPVKVA